MGRRRGIYSMPWNVHNFKMTSDVIDASLNMSTGMVPSMQGRHVLRPQPCLPQPSMFGRLDILGAATCRHQRPTIFEVAKQLQFLVY